MSTAAQDMLAKMQKGGGVQANPDDFYVKLIISKQRRRLLMFGLSMAFAVMVFLVAFTWRSPNATWLAMSLPIIGTGLIVTLIPITEDWAYRPWQSSARQYEKHFHYRR